MKADNIIEVERITYLKLCDLTGAEPDLKTIKFMPKQSKYLELAENCRYQKDFMKMYPLPVISTELQMTFQKIFDYIFFLKSRTFNDLTDKLMPVYFEQIIDGMVYELYFNEKLCRHQRDIIKYLGNLPDISSMMSDTQQLDTIRAVFKRLNDREHPVRINLFFMDSIPEIRSIKEPF